MEDEVPAEPEVETQAEPDQRVWDLGTGLVEYALLTALIAIVALGSIQFFASATTESMSNSASAIEQSVDRAP